MRRAKGYFKLPSAKVAPTLGDYKIQEMFSMFISNTAITSKDVDSMPINVTSGFIPMRQEVSPFDDCFVYLDSEAIDMIMASALDGINESWCKKVEPFGEYDPEEFEYLSDSFSQGHNLLFFLRLKSGRDVSCRLTMTKFCNGIKLWLKSMNRIELDRYIDDNNELVGYKVNSYEADRIIQYALFGKIVVK